MNIVSPKQQRIAELAQQSRQMAFTSLAYHMDVAWLREAYQRTRKDGAVGVDGVTAAEFEQDLEGNLQRLFDNIPHKLIVGAVAAEVADGNILRLVEKFLAAGVMVLTNSIGDRKKPDIASCDMPMTSSSCARIVRRRKQP